MLKKLNLKELIKGGILSVFPLIILIVGYSIGSREDAIWIALAITQLGLSILWVITRLGAFSTTGYGMRKYARSHANYRERKYENEPTYKKINRKDLPSSAAGIVEESLKKSWQGIFLAFGIGLVELAISLIISFA